MNSTNPYRPPQAPVHQVDDIYQGAYQEMKLWSWRGRLGRLRFMGYSAVAYLVYMIATMLVVSVAAASRSVGSFNLVIGLLLVPYLFFVALVMIRRSHDMGWSGWMSLLAVIPFVGLIWVFKAGTPAANEYGAPPPPNTTGVKVAAFGILGIFVIGILAAVTLPAYQQYTLRASQAAQHAPSK